MASLKWIAAGAVAAAAATLAWTHYAKAADLGGTCCADLEGRVAELEAATVRKGNRKVAVKISGQINKALLYVRDGSGSERGIVDNLNSPSRLTVSGEAKTAGGYSAGFLVELGLTSPDDEKNAGGLVEEMHIRYNAVWVGTPLGKVWLGHTSTATDGVVELNLANVNVVALPAASWLGFDGSRTQVVKYESPVLAGFQFSASLNEVLSTSVDSWDAALRYAGEGGGFRFGAAIGYADNGLDVTRVSGSASLMHVATGLFVTGNAGRIDGAGEVYGGTAGIERNWFGIGRTTLFGEYSTGEDVTAAISPLGVAAFGPIDELTVFGFGMVQAVDALGLDLYGNYRNVEIDGHSADVFMVGMRVSY